MKSYIRALIAFALVLASCSKEQEIITPPAPNKYTITITAEAGGSVSSPGGTYNEGSKITITATPDGQYLFDKWSDGSTVNPREITVTSNLTLKASFIKKTYPLAVTIEGEGTVQEEVIIQGSTSETTYNAGTTVRLTATPNEGWVFAGWSGDLTSNDPVIELTIEKGMAISALFNKSLFSISTSEIIIPNSSQYGHGNLYESIVNITAKIYYSNAYGDYFIFGPSTSSDYANVDSREDAPPAFPIVLKEMNGEWILDQIYNDVPIWLARNFKRVGENLVIGDGNELGKYGAAWASENLEDRFKWRGNAYLADLSNESIVWTKVNNADNMAWFHGITFGDINGDGLIDVGGTPAPSIKLFLNGGGNNFFNDDSFINYRENLNWPLSIEFNDLDNDGIDEIITASYGNINNSPEEHNALQVFKLNGSTEKFESVYYDNFISGTGGNVLGATSIKVFDFNNDGIKDISVCREDTNNDSFEIWLGNSNNDFEPYFFQNLNTYEIKIKEFEVMDVNLDGFLDIVLNIFMGQGFNTPNGLNFNKAIWINDGSGKFNMYSQNDLTIDVQMNSYTSFMKDGVLNFIAPHLPAEEVNSSEDLSFRFKHLKFYLN